MAILNVYTVGIYTVSTLDGKRKNSSSVQFHIQVLNNNKNYGNCEMYHVELGIKDATESNTSASFLNSDREGRYLTTSLYDKRDDFSVHIA